ncbi:MAG: HEAT repeat domain-containing protein [Gammaproteobacteria bacterium]
MTKEQKNIVSPLNSSTSILMLMGKQCAYCGPMMQILTEMMKAGQLAELRIVNIEENPELARQLGVRSVPWLQIGPFELQGARSRQEIVLWLERASNFAGLTEYLDEVLAEGNIGYANKLIQRYPQALENVIALMADPQAKINVRLGVGVMIEEMAESEAFKVVIPRLIDYLSDKDARIRGDACHYLSLTKDSSTIPFIEKLLSDENEEVREIAQESLDALR